MRLLLFSVVVLFFNSHFKCQEVEISDDDPIPLPNPASVEKPVSTEEDVYKGSPDVSVVLSFVEPPFGMRESISFLSLVAGKPASFITSLENVQNSSSQYTLVSLEAALHYPRYFGYHIQNFTVQRLQNTLEPKHQASLFYTFTPAVQLAGQRFDLVVILTYQDQTGKSYFHSLFNETIALLEDGEGMDVELIFLGVLVSGVCILAAVFIWHWISNKTAKRVHGGKSVAVTQVNEYLIKKPTSANVSPTGSVKRRQGKK